jgi:hypothetical protein
MEEYAHRANIRRFELDLEAEKDPQKRELLKALLETEREGLRRVLREKGRLPREPD